MADPADRIPLRLSKDAAPIQVRGAAHLLEDIDEIMRTAGTTKRGRILLHLLRLGLDDYYRTGILVRPPGVRAKAGSTAPAPAGRPKGLADELQTVVERTGIPSRNTVILILLKNAIEDLKALSGRKRTQLLSQPAAGPAAGDVSSTTPEDLGGGARGRRKRGGEQG